MYTCKKNCIQSPFPLTASRREGGGAGVKALADDFVSYAGRINEGKEMVRPLSRYAGGGRDCRSIPIAYIIINLSGHTNTYTCTADFI